MNYTQKPGTVGYVLKRNYPLIKQLAETQSFEYVRRYTVELLYRQCKIAGTTAMKYINGIKDTQSAAGLLELTKKIIIGAQQFKCQN